MKGKRRAWVIVGLLAVALVAVAVPLAEPVWWWVQSDKVPLQEVHLHSTFRPLRGWEHRKAWGRDAGTLHGRQVIWWVENGKRHDPVPPLIRRMVVRLLACPLPYRGYSLGVHRVAFFCPAAKCLQPASQ